jgi:hypothetical protein
MLRADLARKVVTPGVNGKLSLMADFWKWQMANGKWQMADGRWQRA